MVGKNQSNYSFTYSNLLDIPRVRTFSFGKNVFRYAAQMYYTAYLNISGLKVASCSLLQSGIPQNVYVLHLSSHIYYLCLFIKLFWFEFILVAYNCTDNA